MPVLQHYDHTALIRSTCRESFWEFCKEFWSEIPGAGRMIENWHMQYLADELQKIAERVFKSQDAEYDEIINVPPGTSKSSIGSILFMAWTWTRGPNARHLNASHTESLVLDLADKSRQVIKSEKYQRCFPEIQLKKEVDAKGYFANSLGGSRYACTVGGKSPMGFHAHFLVGDDLIDPQKVASEAELKTAREFISNYLPTRMTDKRVTPMVLIMQRLGRGDPTDVMQEIGRRDGARPVRRVCLPAELTEDVEPKELREKYIDGLLDPQRMPRTVLENYRARGEYHYVSQFLQNPIQFQGGMFKPSYFNQRVIAAPYQARRVRYWDRASSIDAGACYTAGVLMSRDNLGNFYIEDCVHGQWEPDERNQRMRAAALHDRNRYGPKQEPKIYVEAEGGSSGKDAWKGVVRALAGFPVYEDQPTGKKDTRAEPWACQLAAGNVKIVDDGSASWDINGYIQEHLLFKPDPGAKRLGRWKDMVDASSGAFKMLIRADLGPLVRTFITGGALSFRDKGKIRIIICSAEELATTIIEEPAVLISIVDPEKGLLPGNRIAAYVERPISLHACNRLLGSVTLQFGDIDPAEKQEEWIPEIGELSIKPEHGKKVWRLLTAHYDPGYRVIVIQDDGGEDRRGISIACAICEKLSLPNTVIYKPAEPVRANWMPTNRHVFDTVKMSRYMVIT